jgi:predicted PurR-regulated permease PerM
MVPIGRLRNVTRVVARIDEVLSGFLRGELVLFLAATVAFTVGLAVLQVPFALVVGPLAAMVYLVPYIGVLVGATLCLLLSALAGHAFLHVVGVIGLFAAFYIADLLFITPRMIGNRVGLPPVVVLLGIIAFGELFGLIGVLLAIPVLATGRILLLEAMENYRGSSAYLGAEGMEPISDVTPISPRSHVRASAVVSAISTLAESPVSTAPKSAASHPTEAP